MLYYTNIYFGAGCLPANELQVLLLYFTTILYYTNIYFGAGCLPANELQVLLLCFTTILYYYTLLHEYYHYTSRRAHAR
jgi:hypothetical protein